jgi:hypothetical protein
MLVSALVGVAVAAWLTVVLAWLVVVVDTVLTRYRIVAGHLARLPFDPADAPPAPPDVEERLAELAADENGNVVVYSGYSPFVGSGYEVGGWSFAVNTDRPKGAVDGGKSPTPFEASEIHDAVARALRTLPLDGLAVEDRLFVSGKHVRDDRRFLPDQFSRPVARVGPEVVEEVRRAPTPVARVYLDVRVVDWQGELVFSTFVRFSKTGNCLFAEASHFVLPSLASHYHVVDGLTPQPTARSLATIAGQSLVALPKVMPASAAKTVMGAAGPSRRSLEDRSVRRSIRENNAFDYGATTSIRQQGTAAAYQRYFQLLDKEMYLKVVERRLIDTILAFLDEKGVDTSDLRQQSQHIYNNGVIVNGGALNSHNVAVGTGARATASGAFQALAHAVVPSAPAGGTK